MMTQLQKCTVAGLAVAVAVLIVPLAAQVGDPGTLIKEKLVSQVKLTKAAADHSDIVTAGDVVVLHKDGLMMCSSASSYAFSNTYANGVLAANLSNRVKQGATDWVKGKLNPFGGGSSAKDAANNGCTSRKFVAGEKFWVTDIALVKDGIVVSTFSDPYNDVRYYGEIKFPFAKGSVPPVDAMVKTFGEVITVQPSDDATEKAAKPDKPKDEGAAASTTAAMAPIAPPPPPPDQPPAPPKTISKGQTKDVVIATWGQPTKDIQLGAKEILVYPDMKVVLVAGKVSDVQ